MKNNIKLSLLPVLAALAATDVNAALWVRTLDGSDTANVTGTITLDDWGFVGPQGRQADSFEPHGGIFGNGKYDTMGAAHCIADPQDCGIGQMQHVITTDPDGLTPDQRIPLVKDDFGLDWLAKTGDFENVNPDALTTFYLWAYTTVGGSTFNNMLIDLDGDYRIAQEDMSFQWYDIIDYKQVIYDGTGDYYDESGNYFGDQGEVRIGTQSDSDPDAIPPVVYHNSLNFQPYAVSDAIGWCGSVVADHPNAHQAMAGQVKFDIIMDVYVRDSNGVLGFFSSELTTDFEMRSFGDIVVDLTDESGGKQEMAARAVVNNTDPTVPNQSVGPATPVGDLSQHNRVSFMGSSILPDRYWCGIESADWVATLPADRGPGLKRFASIRKDLTDQVACEGVGGVWGYNAFSGYGYILRADAGRYIDWFDESVYGPDPMADTDSDGVPHFQDNCSAVANADQQDTDADNFGNACDADFNNDNMVNSIDIGLFKTMFFATGDVEADLNGDGIVNALDIGLFKARFFTAPGPSGTAP